MAVLEPDTPGPVSLPCSTALVARKFRPVDGAIRCERHGVVRANGRDARLEAGGDPGPERLIRRGQFHKERRMVRFSVYLDLRK